MIKSWAHKGLKELFDRGKSKKVDPKHARKLLALLDQLDAAARPTDMDVPGGRFHSLKGNRAGQYAVSVSGNWRLIFEFDGADVTNVDYDDYH